MEGPQEDLLRKALDLALQRGATYAEVRYQAEIRESLNLKNGYPIAGGTTVSRGVGIRVIVDGALGFSSTNVLKPGALREAVEEAIGFARATAKLRRGRLGMAPAEFAEDRVVVKPRVRYENVDVSDRVELLRAADGAVVEGARRIGAESPSRLFSLACGYTEKHVINSDGADVFTSIPRVALSLVYHVHHQGRSQMRHKDLGETRGWEGVERWRLDEELLEDAEGVAGAVVKGVAPPEGAVDVVLGPEVVGLICHESAGHPGEADRMLGREAAQAGETYIKRELVGMRIGSEHVTIADDPTLPWSYGFYLYDDEGVRARERLLIERGVIKELLQNRETAAELGTSSNGSSRASSYDREPIVRMANTYMKPGNFGFDELIEDVKLGVYIKTYSEWNIDDKRWNQRYVGVEAYAIRDGELAEPVFRPILEVTTRTLYSSVDAVGKDLQMTAGYCGKGDPMQAIPVWFGGPHIRLRSVRLLKG
ncbi:MAG: TldD/PmbA family protein [Aigarchaeota archaeon]|nr:TldD/PmbA family protein [Aigarchaeota archaeon]